ncbi:SpoIIE family protein phosphatase [Streptomyces sp. KHY 26]|uniref:ATP-binding SpoIIE family protein phosphatase n=1 Tax=Streptomyces sp. KHY 26 TaxID=3097359 RepID=UPI00376F1EA2
MTREQPFVSGAQERTFAFDGHGRSVGTRGGLPGDGLGKAPAHLFLAELLDRAGCDASAVLQLDVWRDTLHTHVAVAGTAPTTEFARAQAAYARSAFEHAPAGIELYDPDLRVLRSNAAALRIRGRPASEVLHRTAADLDPSLPTSRLLHEVLNGPEQVAERFVSVPTKGGGHRVHRVTALCLRDGATVVGAATLFHDVTSEARSRAAERLLAAAHRAIGTTLSAVRTSQEVATTLTQDFADAVSVDLVDAVLHGADPPGAPLDASTPLRRTAFAAPGGLAGVYTVGEPSNFVFPTPYTQVLTDLTPRLVDPSGALSDWLMHDAARAGALRAAHIHSLIVAPLTHQHRVLGLVCLYRGPRHPAPFDTQDVALVEQVMAKASAHVENARRYMREHTTAVTLQQRLLPRSLPEVTAVSTAHFWLPEPRRTAWFDVLPLSSARVALVIGDVPEQGLDASVDMGRLRTAVTTLAALELPPQEVLAHLDDVVPRLALTGTTDADPDMGLRTERARCQYCVYDPVSGDLSVASAGWPAPLVTAPDGRVRELPVPPGPALGGGTGYEVARTRLEPGSVLTLYSASLLPESPHDDPAALLRQAAAAAPGDARNTCDSVVYRTMSGSRKRGAAVLTAVAHRLPAENVSTWTGSREPADVAASRRRVRAQLADWGLADHSFATETIVSELVTNVLRHASGAPQVRLIKDSGLTVEVSDRSATAPHLRHARTQEENGRGLFIAAALARRWGTRYTSDGKCIWVEQDLTGADVI